jgi:ABC-type transporter Mla subunit MlaD
MVKRIWRHKWWVVIATVVVFLSIGAVAWAATGSDESSGSTATALATDDTGPADVYAAVGSATGLSVDEVKARIENLRQKGERFLQRQAALMDKLREQMSQADQELHDKLVAAAKDQREALKEARQNLAETLKQLRELRNKYLDEALGGTN